VSAEKPRKVSASAFPKRRPELRLVKNSDRHPRPGPDPEMRATLSDMKRCYRVQHERIERDADGKDAA
jgi:hypothetical protein